MQRMATSLLNGRYAGNLERVAPALVLPKHRQRQVVNSLTRELTCLKGRRRPSRQAARSRILQYWHCYQLCNGTVVVHSADSAIQAVRIGWREAESWSPRGPLSSFRVLSCGPRTTSGLALEDNGRLWEFERCDGIDCCTREVYSAAAAG